MEIAYRTCNRLCSGLIVNLFWPQKTWNSKSPCTKKANIYASGKIFWKMVKIIGAGLCRTGTTSTVVALDNLGLGPVYHYNEVCFYRLILRDCSNFGLNLADFYLSLPGVVRECWPKFWPKIFGSQNQDIFYRFRELVTVLITNWSTQSLRKADCVCTEQSVQPQ